MTPRDDEYGTTTPQFERTEFREEATEPLAEKSTAELEAEIVQIRAEMDTTLNAIERRFSTSEMLDRALHSIQGGPAEFAANLGRTVRDHPVPATLVGIGLGWLFLSEAGVTQAAAEKTGEWKESGGEISSQAKGKLQQASHAISDRLHQTGERLHHFREEARGRRETISGKASRIRETIRENPLPAVLAGMGLGWLFLSGAAATGVAAEKTGEWQETGSRMKSQGREKLQEASHSLSERMHRTGEKARETRGKLTEQAHNFRERAQQAQGGFRHLRDEKPMLLAALGVAVGVVFGTLLPITRREEEVLGETGVKAREMIGEQAQKIGQKAGQVAGAAAEAAREEAERQIH